MHFDFTIRFWPMLANVISLLTVFGFSWQSYKAVKRVVDKIVLLIDQHHEMYGWYQKQAGKPNGGALGKTAGPWI